MKLADFRGTKQYQLLEADERKHAEKGKNKNKCTYFHEKFHPSPCLFITAIKFSTENANSFYYSQSLNRSCF